MKLLPLTVRGASFRDSAGREALLRGVNLGGDCKFPYPHGGTNYPSDFSDHRTVSFIGRPFPLEDADEHLGRLRHWGFNVLRLLTTWEAVEHEGPGIYDEAYLDYFTALCRKAGEYGLYVFVDFHEDAWSRMTGGSGAPGWVFEAVGLDFTQFHPAGLSHVMQLKYDYALGGRQDSYPQMTWGSNHRLSPGGIMWTLFFTGRLFTPDFLIGGVNVQDFLQSHYIGAMKAVAARVADFPNVLGFDTLNEPVPGWIGKQISYRHLRPTADNPSNPRIGLALSPLDNLLAAQGIPISVPRILRDPDTGAFSVGDEEIINPDGISIWLPGKACPFEAAGAYTVKDGKVTAIDEDFFCGSKIRPVSAAEEAYAPLFDGVSEAIQAFNPSWAVFAELEPYSIYVGGPFPKTMPSHSVNASHWYDSSTLYTKSFNAEQAYDFTTRQILYGREAIKASYLKQMQDIADLSKTLGPDGAPTLIGEFGIPFDLDGAAAYQAWEKGDRSSAPWQQHIDALTLTYEAFDELKLHGTLWNYTASNRNALEIGDGWNQEDLSIYSVDQRENPEDPNSGGRAVEGFCRPFVRFAQGNLIGLSFAADQRVFHAEIEVNGDIEADSEIYLPRLHFGNQPIIETNGPSASVVYDSATQCALIRAAHGLLQIRVKPETNL
ncbi:MULTISPECIES: glycoside hydrolase family 5 protein [unclassified Rhizobium]|uniref:glycoside hydrolase family 5 protein n=1 Tax=unclassified Rhizobium TaxID=2613769 RepID=UPI001ADC58ED|nr:MULTISPECIES: cellulase family glycosylhydrolase [unclassified Rhizobium]MBO9102024.1 cellulase family glycosylhydrolase [Rhizobium sp. L58/93]MBO9171854.1 cellulase family glycosylhydrolase [Rhizobium sp. L245/93]MBO9187974.1 cellulase family glycosylhydrolase [Rhizobium sp. E27B/91]QXZ86061.1 cellulase family glycosylhydrolase [Rhizobium sp. K1/93]QXZ92481.1 cellulase family glycosylhydrolase [Rhizobium sp. K15/93]